MSVRPTKLLRLVQSKTKSQHTSRESYNLYVACSVKPNSSAQRTGIRAVDSDRIEVSVAEPPRDGAANLAVSKVFAEIFNVPKSSVEVVRGLKTREKTVCVSDVDVATDGKEEFLQRARDKLRQEEEKNEAQ